MVKLASIIEPKQTKHCYSCQTVKDVSGFGKNTARRDGLQSYCKHCRANADRANYLKDPQRKYREHYAYKQGLKLKVYNYLSTHPCVDCGEANPIFLEFDHVRGEKFSNLGTLLRNNKGWNVIEKEIAKCAVRCIKCHRIKTAKQFGWYKWLEQVKGSGSSTA